MRPTELTRRELEIASLVHQEFTNKQISAALHIEEATVKTHLHRLSAKLGVSSRVGVAVWYERRSLPDRLRELAKRAHARESQASAEGRRNAALAEALEAGLKVLD